MTNELSYQSESPSPDDCIIHGKFLNIGSWLASVNHLSFLLQKTEKNSLLTHIQIQELTIVTKTVTQENRSTLVSSEKAVTSHSTTPEQNETHSRTKQVVRLQLTHHHIIPHAYVVHYFTGL